MTLLILSVVSIKAQNITAKVLDSETKEALIGATALLQGTTKGGIAGIDGVFTITNVGNSSYNVIISYYGYEEITKSVSVSGEDVDLGEILMKSEIVNLDEVEVFADVVEERKSPIAVSSISAEKLEERFSNVSIAEAIQNTPGVYSIQGAGGYGDQEVYIRGFDQSNVAFLVNGIPVNDMENGRMYWSNFAGLNQVTRTMQVQRGLGASKLAISSIGGTVNMITKPSDRKKGGRVEYMMGTGSWNNRLRFTYNTGLSDNGWAFSLQGTRTTTGGGFEGLYANKQGAILPGAFTDAWSYYVSLSKKINDKHQLMFWAFGAPVNRGTAWTVDDKTRKDFGITQPNFNNALGYRNGDLFNARQNKTNKPMTALTHYWDIDGRTSVTTSLYYSRARVLSTQPRDAKSGLFLSDRISLVGQGVTSENLIDWDYLMTQNRDTANLLTVKFPNGDINIDSVKGYASRYYLESRHNNHDWIGLVSNYTKQLQNVRIRGGVDLRHYRGEHYAEVFDLMGGDFIKNQDRYGNIYNKIQGANPIARKGDKTNYFYDGIVNWGSVFGQVEATINKFILFGAATLTYSDMQRVGHFWSGNTFTGYESSSYGKSEKKDYLTYTFKAGANYQINGRHNVYVNGGHFTRPPYLRNAFQDGRYSNKYRIGVKPESIYSTEVGYGFKASFLKLNLNGYYLLWQNRTTQIDVDDPDQSVTIDIPLVLNGMVSEHKGVELDFEINPTPTFEINGYVSLGDWKWKTVPNQKIVIGRLTFLTDDLFNVKNVQGLPVGAAAQTTAGLGFHYKGIRKTYIGARANYADRIPIRYTLEDVSKGYITSDIIKKNFDDYATVDIYMGRYFDIGENMRGRISFNVNNVLNTKYTRWASYFLSQVQRGYGYSRTFTIGLSLSF